MKCDERKKRLRYILLAIAVGGILLVAIVKKDNPIQVLQRNEPEEGNSTNELLAIVDGQEYPYTVELDERTYTRKEAAQYMEQAIKEIEQKFLGVNTSVDEIRYPVCMDTSYCEDRVSAVWSLDREDLIDKEGAFLTDRIADTGETIQAHVHLSCGSYQQNHIFYFRVYPPKEGIQEKIYRKLENAKQKNPEEAKVELPTQIGGRKIRWEEGEGSSLWFVPIWLLGMVVLFQFKKKEDVRKEKQHRESALLMEYPKLVSSLSLLIGAGLTVSKAWERMVLQYRKKGIYKVAYEEMQYTWNEIREGVSERKAYENFGKRCGLTTYKKLTSILIQNLRKGNERITELLVQEADEAMQKRRNDARRLGEEASTKLLAPMMLLLGVVMVIVITPAIIQM